MALPATDNFNRANGGLGANWTTPSGASAPSIVSNQCSHSFDSSAFWNADSFNGNHYAQVLVDSTTRGGPAVRVQSGADSLYGAVNDNGQGSATQIRKRVAASNTLLASYTTIAAGHTVKLDVSGSTLTVYDNGVSVTSTTDSAITGGAAGTYGAAGTVDDWQGDNVAASLTAAQQIGIFDQQLSGCVIGRVDG